MKKIIAVVLVMMSVMAMAGCNQDDEDLDKCAEMILELACLSYDNYGDYSKLPEKYHGVISKHFFECLNYRGCLYKDLKDYKSKRGVDYYEVQSLSYPTAEYDGDDIVVSYKYTFDIETYDNATVDKYDIPEGGSADIPVTVTLKENNGKFKVIDKWEAP